MNKPEVIKGTTFADLLKEAETKSQKAHEELSNNKGMCLSCGNHPAEKTNECNNYFHCKDCNNETEELLNQLRGPGFFELKI